MAHEIEHDDTVAYAGETPWHGIGQEVSADLTPDEMMVAANLNWKVLEYRLGLESQRNPGTYRPIDKGFKGLVRSSDGKLLDIVTDDYRTHQNSQIFGIAKQFFETGGMHMETAGSLQGGRVIWALARLDASFILPDSTDKTTMYALFSTGHKQGFATQVDLTAIRVVCANTIRMARGEKGKGGDGEKFGRFRLIHATTFTRDHAAQAVQVMEAGVSALAIYRHKAELLSGTLWSAEARRAFACELFAPKLFAQALKETDLKGFTTLPDSHKAGYDFDYVLNRTAAYFGSGNPSTQEKITKPANRVIELVETQPGSQYFPESGWNAYNAVTRYVDHERGRTRDSALNSAWYGEGATVKQNALDLALAYTEAIRQ